MLQGDSIFFAVIAAAPSIRAIIANGFSGMTGFLRWAQADNGFVGFVNRPV